VPTPSFWRRAAGILLRLQTIMYRQQIRVHPAMPLWRKRKPFVSFDLFALEGLTLARLAPSLG